MGEKTTTKRNGSRTVHGAGGITGNLPSERVLRGPAAPGTPPSAAPALAAPQEDPAVLRAYEAYSASQAPTWENANRTRPQGQRIVAVIERDEETGQQSVYHVHCADALHIPSYEASSDHLFVTEDREHFLSAGTLACGHCRKPFSASPDQPLEHVFRVDALRAAGVEPSEVPLGLAVEHIDEALAMVDEARANHASSPYPPSSSHYDPARSEGMAMDAFEILGFGPEESYRRTIAALADVKWEPF